MTKLIEITLTVEVPEEASSKDIKDWVDVEFRHVNSMKKDNPCIHGAEVVDASIRE
ncbi:hypothetical protein [Vibrio crassostreae]|uniref:hypothetical protein n=1 Tax=Vibrio crassostreae TaxID=246167 RepID=UPI001B31887A|nr:hypothetical protein [Vibrio crassostreae]